MKQTTKTIIFTVIILVIGGYYFFTKDTSTIQPSEFSSNILNVSLFATSTTAVETKSPEGRVVYKNEPYKFSFFYPEEMAVKEFDEGGGASAFIFENAKKGLGFQIFVVPYMGEQVSEERFLRDVPSGIRKNPSDFYIDGVLATSFYSKGLELGETWEVWFIYNGFLYEVTTPKGLDSWLQSIMQTWKFL